VLLKGPLLPTLGWQQPASFSFPMGAIAEISNKFIAE